MTASIVIAALAVLSVGLFVVAIAESDGREHFGEAHHEYWGLALLVLALGLHWPVWVALVALAIMADDTVQHTVQLEHPDFLSPLHRLYVAAAVWLIHRSWCPPFLARWLAH